MIQVKVHIVFRREFILNRHVVFFLSSWLMMCASVSGIYWNISQTRRFVKVFWIVGSRPPFARRGKIRRMRRIGPIRRATDAAYPSSFTAGRDMLGGVPRCFLYIRLKYWGSSYPIASATWVMEVIRWLRSIWSARASFISKNACLKD